MKNVNRQYSKIDMLCLSLDQALRAIAGNPATTERQYPAAAIAQDELTSTQQKLSVGLMRVNHAGEVSAQALYHGQGLTSRNSQTRIQMQEAAREEGDHLAWCHRRLIELGSHRSYLNPLWYIGSFAIGLSAGVVGDKWSLGFVAETERQVVKHLEEHLLKLPANDVRSMKILEQMRIDEGHHREEAIKAGGVELPGLVKRLMSVVSKIMVKTAFWI